MYPVYPGGSAPPPYGFAPPTASFPDPSGYGAPAAPGMVAESQVGYAPQAPYPPVPYAPQPGFPVPGYPPAPSNFPATTQPQYPSQGFQHQPEYGTQLGYAAQPPYASGYSAYPQAAAAADYSPASGYPSAPPAQPQPRYPLVPPDPQPSASSPWTASHQSPVQQTAMDEERVVFMRLAGDDGEIDAYELQDILNQEFKKQFSFDGFSVDMTRSMVAMSDLDMSGKLGFDDYKSLRSDLMLCRTTFQTVDNDRSGFLDKAEFHRALSMLGLNVSERSLAALVMRYADKHGRIRFNDFVACFIKLKTMMKMFERKDIYRQGNAEFHRDECNNNKLNFLPRRLSYNLSKSSE